MLYALLVRKPVELHVLHDRNPLFVQLSSGEIRNGYTLKILNKTHAYRNFDLSIEGLPDAEISVKAAGESADNVLKVGPDSVGSYHVLVSSKVEASAPRDINIVIMDQADPAIRADYSSVFMTRNK